MARVEKNLGVIGLKSTGKSTFIAALWHCVEHDDRKTVLFAPTLQEDREHLNELRDKWLEFANLGRTSIRGGEHYVKMVLEARETGKQAIVSVPDLSGESFSLQWEEQKAKPKYIEYTRNVDAVLLFLHPHHFRLSPRIDPAKVPTELAPTTEGDHPVDDEVKWEPKTSSTSVQLVEILQVLLRVREGSGVVPVAVIISAWDRVKPGVTPDDWLARRAPLLDQFLRARDDAFRLRVYGVSAQGGDLVKDKKNLEAYFDARERVTVVEEGEHHKDLSAPVSWALQQIEEHAAQIDK